MHTLDSSVGTYLSDLRNRLPGIVVVVRQNVSTKSTFNRDITTDR